MLAVCPARWPGSGRRSKPADVAGHEPDVNRLYGGKRKVRQREPAAGSRHGPAGGGGPGWRTRASPDEEGDSARPLPRAARMDSGQETSERSGIGPQTAAARGGARSAPESERRPTAPESEPQPRPGELRVRRLTEPKAPPASARERVSALLALASAVGVVAFLVSSLTPSGGVGAGAT